jgi:hypothetical protein
MEPRVFKFWGWIAKVSALMVVLIALIGCPHSKLYQGLSDGEREHFNKSSREIFPNDVRNDLERFRATKVAWPGFITEGKWAQVEEGFVTTFFIEHHFYDWILDYSIQKEKIFLSPKGEGMFATNCTSKAEQESQTASAVGNLIIVYGTPVGVEEGIVTLSCDYARLIKREWVRTDVFEYGRPGEPIKFMNLPGPGAGTVLKKNPSGGSTTSP